jgi:hypothetical protein
MPKKKPASNIVPFKVRRTEERYLALSTLVQLARQSDLGDPDLEDWAYGILDGSTTGHPPVEAQPKKKVSGGDQ